VHQAYEREFFAVTRYAEIGKNAGPVLRCCFLRHNPNTFRPERWLYDIPYRGRTVRAYFASGNGGQFSFGFDELDLAVVFYGGNYNDWESGYAALKEFLPNDVLPTVQEGR